MEIEFNLRNLGKIGMLMVWTVNSRVRLVLTSTGTLVLIMVPLVAMILVQSIILGWLLFQKSKVKP